MNWKEFFKPTKKKILLVLALFVAGFIVLMLGMMKQWFNNGFLWAFEANISIGWKVACLFYDTFRITIGGPFQLIIVIGVNRIFHDETVMMLFLDNFRKFMYVYLFIYWYLLSCLFVFLWGKIKNKFYFFLLIILIIAITAGFLISIAFYQRNIGKKYYACLEKCDEEYSETGRVKIYGLEELGSDVTQISTPEKERESCRLRCSEK